jgi:hypothetical protein
MATTTSTKPKKTMLMRVGLLIGGLQTSPPTVTQTLVVQGKSYTVAQIIALLVVVQTLLQAAVSAHAAATKAVAAVKAQMTANRALLTAIRATLIQAYGLDVEGLLACGIVVKPRSPRTSQQKTITAAKAAATRVINGTGKKVVKPTHTVTVTDASGQVVGAPALPAPAAAAK